MSDYQSQEYTLQLLEWKVKRENTVKLIRAVGQEIQRNHKNVNIAKLSGASASIVGSGLIVGGVVASFFTFGTSLALTCVGIGLVSAGGITAGGSSLTEYLISKSNMKIFKAALDDDREATRKLDELIQKINKAHSALSLAFSVAPIPLDVYTLVKTFYDVRSIPEVVNDINKRADALEAELKELGGNERLMKKEEEEERPTKDEEDEKDETQMKEENDRQKKQSSA